MTSHHPIYFKAFLLPPAAPLIDDTNKRDDLNFIKLITKQFTLAGKAPSKIEIEQAEKKIADLGRVEHEPNLRTRAIEWVESSLKTFLDHKNSDKSPATDAVFILVASEFALNGYINDAGELKYDAGAPLSEESETFIADHIEAQLKTPTYSGIHIVFVFSCATYSPKIMLPDVDPDKSERNTYIKRMGTQCYTVGANNRITVVTSDPHVLIKRIAKFAPGADNSDKWMTVSESVKKDGKEDIISRPVFSQQWLWSVKPETKGHPVQTVTPEIGVPIRDTVLSPLVLNWNDNQGKNIKLGFGTCYDVVNDISHGAVNMCVYVGSGLPIDLISDRKNQFLLNDTQVWTFPADTFPVNYKTPGFYIFSENPTAYVLKTDYNTLHASKLSPTEYRNLKTHYNVLKKTPPPPEKWPTPGTSSEFCDLIVHGIQTDAETFKKGKLQVTAEYMDVPPQS